MTKKIPLIALVGQPNSGKSTLLNKLIGKKTAIVSKEAHTTRDLNYGEDFWDGIYMRFVDTGGLVPDPEDKIQSAVQLKSWTAIAQADLLIWVIDRKKDPEIISQKIIQKIWKSGKPFIICINKVDDVNSERSISEYAYLGGNGFVNISCNTGYGFDELMEEITLNLVKLGFEQDFSLEFGVDNKKKRRSHRRHLKDVKRDKDGKYVIIRNDEGVFESVPGNQNEYLEGEDEIQDVKIENIVIDLNGVLFLTDENIVNQKAVSFLFEQRNKGLGVFYLSNCSESQLEKYNELDFWKVFDGGLISGQSEYMKPDKEFYQEFLAKYSLKASSCLYFDDSDDNIYTADRQGLKSVLFDVETTIFEKELAIANGLEYRIPKVLFLGKPNVGKSSLFNAMVGKDIQIVTDIAGTTMSINDMMIERIVPKTYSFEIEKPQTSQKKHLIFDFDGVLGDTYEHLGEINRKIQGLETVEEGFKFVDKYFDSKPQHNKETSLDKVEKWKEVILEVGEYLSKQSVKLFDGFVAEIASIENANIAIVSSGSLAYLLPCAEQSGLEFTHVLGFEDHHSKEEKIAQIVNDWQASIDDIYYFTDTKTDVWELENYLNKQKIIGCSWGYQGFDKLKEVLPENQILKEYSDIHKVIKTDKIANEEFNYRINTVRPYILLDSVGIRKSGQQTFGIESQATYKTVQTAYEADIVCLVVDGSMNLTHQDQVVAGVAKEAKKGIVVIVNKADLVEPKERKKFIHEFEYKFGFLHVEGFIWLSAKNSFETQGHEIDPDDENKSITDLSQIWRMIDKSLMERNKTISKEDLRKLFNFIVKKKPPQKLRSQKKAVLYDLLYIKNNPPTFNLLVKDRDSIHWSFTRFLENIIRKNFGFFNTEIKVKIEEVDKSKVLSY